MPVKQYEIEGQLYNVSEEREADFLNDFKDKEITLVSSGEQEDDIDPPVKTTDGVAGADAPSVSAAPQDMDFSLEDTFLEPQEQEVVLPAKDESPFQQYRDKLTNLITEEDELSFDQAANAGPETIAENVSFSELRASGLMKPGDPDYYPGGGTRKIEKQVYPYTPFLKQAKLNSKEDASEEEVIDLAKQFFIDNERRKTIEKRSEEVLEEFEKEFYTTGDRISKLAGMATGGFPSVSDIEYKGVRTALTKDLGKEGEKLQLEIDSDNKAIQNQASIYEAAVESLSWYQKLKNDGIQLTDQELEIANNNVKIANESYNIIQDKLSNLSTKITEVKDISTLTNLTNRTYNNLDVATNRIGSTVMNLLAGLGTVADEFSVKSLIENFGDVDLTNPEDLKFVPEKLQPIVFGLAKTQEKAIEMTAGQLYENARNLNENTKLRQEMGEISSLEDFLEFGLDLFSEQAVNTAVTASTGGVGLGLVSAAAGGQKMNEMNIELENGVKISPWQFYGAGLMYAGGEFISERVSMRQFNNILKIGTRKQFDLAQDLTLENFTYDKAFKKYFKNIAREGNSELFAQLTNNFADKLLLGKDVALTDGLDEAFLSGAFMSALGFGAPVLATDLHRAFSSDKVLQENNARLKNIVDITKEINNLAPLADTDVNAKEAIVALQKQQDKLHNENIASMQSVHSLIDNLSNEDKRLLLDLDSQIYKNKRGIDKINANKRLSDDRKKTLIQELADNNKTINEYKQEIINSSDYSIDKELARKTQSSIRAKTGLELEIIDGENTQDAYQKGIEFINNSKLEPEAKERLRNKLQAAILETDEFRAHGFQFGAEDGLAMSFQIKNNATDGKLGNSTVFSHELAHATVLKKLFEGNSDIMSLVEDFQKYVSTRYKGAKEVFDTVEKVYGDRSDVVIAEEKFNAIKDMFRKYKLQPDKTFKGKILTKWNKITKGDKKPPIAEVKTGQDVFDLMVSFASSFNKGEISGLAADFIEGKVKIIQKQPKKAKDTKAKPVDKDKVTVFSKNKSQEDSKTKQTLDTFTGPAENRKYKTKAEFEASPDYLNAYNYFTEPNPSLDARINSVAAGFKVDFIDVQKVKDNLSLRFVKNFDISKNSLFGWMLGKNPALDFAVLDIIKEDAPRKTVSMTTAEGATIDIADDVSIEDQIDTAMEQQIEAPKSALKQELQKDSESFVDQTLEDAIETNTIEIFEGAKPEFTDASLVPFLKQVSQQKSFKEIKSKVGDAMTFLKDNDNYKTLFHSKNLPISVLVAMERNVPVSDRIFTGEPTRLTTQDQINKAVNEGDFYVENEKTGPSKYPRKKPTLEQLEKFFNIPAINPVTGKRSGLKGTRKDGLVNAISFGLFRDITPSVMRKLDKPQAEIAKTAEKLIVDPDIKFSKSYNKKTKLKQKSEATYLTLLDIVGAKFEINGNTLVYEFVDSPSYEFLGGDVIDPLVSSDGSIIGASGVEIAEGAKTMLGNTRQNFVEANEVVSNFKDPRVVNLENIDFWKNYNFISKASTKKEKINPKLSIEENANIVNDRIIDYRLRQEGIDPNTLIKFSKGLPVDQGFELQEKSNFIFNTSEEVFNSKANITFKEFEVKMRSSFISNNIKNQYLKQNLISLTRASAKGTSGNLFEYYTWHKLNNVETLRNFGIKNLLPKTWNSQIDIEAINLNGDAIGIEVKKDFKDRMGSSSLFIPGASNYTIQSGKYKNKTVKIADNIIELINKNKDLEKVLTDFLNNSKKIDGVVFDKDLGFPFTTIANSKKESTDLRDKLNRPNLVSIDIPISQVKKHYSNKVGSKGQGVNYIIIADEIFSLNNDSDIQGLNLNNLDVEAEINLRIKPSSARNRKSDNKFIESFNLTAEYGFKTKPENGIKFSKSIQTKFSKSLNAEFNRIIERSTGIGARKKISKAKASMLGARKGKFDIFISPSAEDFVGLLYKTLGKGKQGDADLAFYKKALIDPFAKANNLITSERLALMRDYRNIKKQIGIVPKNLRKEIPGVGFTREQAVRAYIWSKQGMEVPGINKGDLKDLLNEVKKSPELLKFGNQLIQINKGDGYAKPSNNWLAGSITTDLLEGINTIKRAKHLQQWQKNVDIIFSKDNMNKLEAAYGTEYRKSLENMLLRMKTGRNRTYGTDSLTGKLTDWINGSVGAIMFFNTRSAVLQTLSATNFVNFKDNNIFAASKAFANQKQYWKDFKELFNSEFLLARRDGLRMNVNEADIAEMAKKGGVRGIINELLRLGFTPTQLADSFAIAAGGATFYRNRIKTYEKEGLTNDQAKKKAFEDFRENAEESQQSSRPDKISQQQAGSLGRLVLAFANTPSQYARIIKKATLDLKNGRGDAKTNISKIVYYTFAQNILFNALQQGLFALAFGDDEQDENKKEKTISLANGMANSLLRGMGFYGAAAAAIKDAALRIYKESEKDQPKYEKAAIDFLNISPPISSKYRKIASAGRTIQFAKSSDMENFDINNPILESGSKLVSATTNVPLDRLLIKTQNINDALAQDVEYWERAAMLLGWQDWQLGIKEKKKATGEFKLKKYKIKTYKIK